MVCNKKLFLFVIVFISFFAFMPYEVKPLRVEKRVNHLNGNYPLAFKIEPNSSVSFFGYRFTYEAYTSLPKYCLKYGEEGTSSFLQIEWPSMQYSFPWLEDKWVPSQTATCRFHFQIAKNITQVGPVYSIYIYNISFVGCEPPVYDVTLTVDKPSINLKNPGDTETVKFTVTNTGNLKIENVKFNLDYTPLGYILVEGESDATNGVISSLDAGASKTFKYTFKCMVETQQFASVTFKVTYSAYTETVSVLNQMLGKATVCKMLGSTSKSKDVYIALGKAPQPYERPNMQITITPVPNLKPGGSAQVTATFENVGNGSAYNASVYVDAAPSELTFEWQGEKSNALGYSTPIRVQGNTPIPTAYTLTLPFTVYVPEFFEGNSKTYTINVKIRYYNNRGDFFESQKNTTVTVIKPGKPMITVQKYLSASQISLGSTVTVTIEVDNIGEGPALNVEVLDSIPGQFQLTSGKYQQSFSNIPAGGKESFSYVIKAVDEFAGQIPSAVVNYKDSEGHSATAKSNIATIKVVKASVTVTKQSAPKEMEVDEIFTLEYDITNKGSGDARDVVLQINYSRGLELINIEGPGEEELGRTVNLSLKRLEPNQIVTLKLRFRGMLPGNQTISVVKKTYKSPDGSVQFSMVGENLNHYIIIKTPFMVRSMLVLMLGFMVMVIEYAVLSATFKITQAKGKKKRFKLG